MKMAANDVEFLMHVKRIADRNREYIDFLVRKLAE